MKLRRGAAVRFSVSVTPNRGRCFDVRGSWLKLSFFSILLIFYTAFSQGSGKGTLSARLVQKYDLNFISTGDVLRREILNGTDVGKECESVVASGGLVSDELMLKVIETELDKMHGKVSGWKFLLSFVPHSAPSSLFTYTLSFYNLGNETFLCLFVSCLVLSCLPVLSLSVSHPLLFGDLQSWLLDGFPRTLRQAGLLDSALNEQGRPLNMIIHLAVPDVVIMKRISGEHLLPPSRGTHPSVRHNSGD